MAKLRRDLGIHSVLLSMSCIHTCVLSPVDQSAYMADIQTEFQRRMPSAVLKDVHQCLLHYHIADTRTLWSSMFAAMEDMKAKYSLEDYVISDTTLEQIFLSFARKQR
jgi:ATP-binding cassette subfamily A (ABC1) protein 3